VFDAAERASGSPEFVAAGLLCALGNLLGRNVALYLKERDSWHEHANLWGMLVAPPGVQKSPLLEAALRPLRRIEGCRRTTWDQENRPQLMKQLAEVEIELTSLSKSRKAAPPDATRITELRGAKHEMETRLRDGAPRFTTADATAEKLGELLIANPGGLLLVRDELTGWLTNLDREGRQGERAFFLQGWNGRQSFDVDRIGRGSLHVPAVCLGVLGTIQPGPLTRYVREAAGGAGADGLIQRFQLLAHPQPRAFQYVDREPDLGALRAVQDLFEALARPGLAEHLGASEQYEGMPRGLRLEPAAQELFIAWYRDTMERVSKEACAPFAAWLAKSPKLFAGLALIFHAAEVVSGGGLGGQAASVGLDATRRAADSCGFWEEHARKVFAPLLRPELAAARALAEKIMGGAIADGITLRDVYKPGWKSLTTPDSVEAAATQLEAVGWVRVVPAATGGRPARTLRINPAVLER
jgi:Protein of unknown function (DUF3987)